MAKSLFGGGAVLTGALLLSSLVFNVHPSVAENLSSPDSNQQSSQKKDANRVELSGKAALDENTNALADDAPNTLTAEPSILKSATQPLLSGKNLTGAGERSESYTATAYALQGRTASGAAVRRGVIAADRRFLPLGSRVRIDAGSYSGEYVVEDRGGSVRGHAVDIWVPSTREATRFGRRPVRLTVLSYGPRPAGRAGTNRARR
ncbi:MAG: 3D domain-containing protein [Acidobacteriota bacterium]|nr:3D domain-containing protein [Acidobacteriota bacterium]